LRSHLASEPVVAGVGTLAALLGEARRQLRSSGRPTDAVDWRALLDGPLPALVRAGALDEAQAALAEAIGG
jgi:hypothetical protein